MPNPHYALTAYNSSNPAPPQDKPKDQWLPYSAHGRTQPRKPSGGFGNFFLVANWSFNVCKKHQHLKPDPAHIPTSQLHQITHEDQIPKNFHYTTSDHWVHYETGGLAGMLHFLAVGALCATFVTPLAVILEVIVNQTLTPIKEPSWYKIWLVCFTAYIIPKVLVEKGWVRFKTKAILFRTTGMVHLFPRGNKEVIIRPYSEFDCSFSTHTGPKGGSSVSIWLSHRYEKHIKFPLNSDATPYTACLACDMFEQFMDVSKPLPDVPESEKYRPYDPTTAEWDKAHNRPPRLFADMSKERWKALDKAIWKYAMAYPWGLDREAAIRAGWQPPPDEFWLLASETQDPGAN